MKAWVNGAGGHMGQHMVDFLIEKGYEVLATYFNPTTNIKLINKKAKVEECDIRNRDKVRNIIKDFEPDEIYHLAAQSFPTKSWEDPWYTIETNIIGTVNIFEAIKEFKLKTKIMNACTSGEYGFVSEDQVPVREDMEKKPLHPYGASKLAQEALGYQYYKNFGIHCVNLRIFNTTGPHKINDVFSDFTRRLIEIEKGINPKKILKTGTLETKRAVTDVRDLVRALYMSLQLCPSGESYNLSGEKVYQIKDVVEILRKLVDFEFETEEDPDLLRTTDEPIIYGDTTKFKKITSWKQDIPLEQTLKDMLNFWRETL